MIIEDNDDLEYNIEISIEANKVITGNSINNVRDYNTLESTFSSCIYYNTIRRLQACSIVNKLSQNQSFEDGNKRTSFFMLNYYNEVYSLGLKKLSDKEYADIILKIANEHWEPKKTCKELFGKED